MTFSASKPPPPADHKSGFVAVVGLPNVGKSTLVNVLVGHKVAGVSAKPQTTRRRILGVRSEPGCQVIFVDTPGTGAFHTRLGELMGRTARAAVREADIILYVIDATQPELGEGLEKRLRDVKAPVVLALNKIDRVSKDSLLPLLQRLNEMKKFEELVPISATKEDGTGRLLDLIKARLPQGPPWYEQSATERQQADQVLVQEVIQEKLFSSVHQEIPYSCGVLIEQMEQDGGLLRIEATIVTERESHKPILIGERGSRLKEIGTEARKELERLLKTKVFLKLWVRIEKDWRNRDALLADLGYARSQGS